MLTRVFAGHRDVGQQLCLAQPLTNQLGELDRAHRPLTERSFNRPMPEYPDLISAQADGAVALQGAVKSFRATDGPVRAALGVDLPVEHGETVAVLGPNGVGKSTTLDILLGLTEPEAGAELTGLLALADRRPLKLSGGQAQRVRLALALVSDPRAARARRAAYRARRRGPPRLLGHDGGSWFPISGHGFLHDLAQALPSYWLVRASYVGLGQGGRGMHGWLVMALWTVAIIAFASRAYQHDTGREA
jgi:hypothetical protein